LVFLGDFVLSGALAAHGTTGALQIVAWMTGRRVALGLPYAWDGKGFFFFFYFLELEPEAKKTARGEGQKVHAE
jgi:hypothetical protein